MCSSLYLVVGLCLSFAKVHSLLNFALGTLSPREWHGFKERACFTGGESWGELRVGGLWESMVN